MPLPTAKLLKIGGPLLTGIGGVFATSQLVSKSADEKKEEKLKTVALKDEEPIIEDYKDANEGKCKKEEGNKCEEGQKGEKGDSQGNQGSGGSGEPSATEGGEPEGPKPKGDGEKPEASNPSEEEEKNKGGEDGDEQKQGKEDSEPKEDGKDAGEEGEQQTGLENGADSAEHLNVHGNAYGTEDKAMTRQDWENFKSVRGSLKGVLDQLTSFAG